MARSRFFKLATEQQDRILNAALREFAAHGFGEASLNRIIADAGISKGSMYYYFDSKEDLYAHVLRNQIERLVQREGPFPVPDAPDPDRFWASLTEQYLRLMKALVASPDAAALLRGWLGGSSSPALLSAQEDAERAVQPWVEGTIEAGRRIGAVRTDLPSDLLIAVAMAMGQAVDVWLISSPPQGSDLDEAVHTLLGMIRRALEP